MNGYLKAYSGDPLREDRLGRDSSIVQQPALSMAVTVQPSVIEGLAEQASMKTKGFLARFLYALPASRVGRRKTAAAAVPHDVATEYAAGMRWLWETKGTIGQDGQPGPNWLTFSDEAEQHFRAFEQWLEPQLGQDGPLHQLAGWGSKLAGVVARLAGILHMTFVANSVDYPPLTIQTSTVDAAIVLGRDYFLPHAVAAFDAMGTNEVLSDARRVVKWLCNSVHSVNSVSQRDIHRQLGCKLKAVHISEVVGLLIEHGYLEKLKTPKKEGRGRKPSDVFEVNPFVWEGV